AYYSYFLSRLYSLFVLDIIKILKIIFKYEQEINYNSNSINYPDNCKWSLVIKKQVAFLPL
ncbi:MAG TPA: hypothetical protein VKO42_00860, partial [Patescibacteria group bacterium]|nr:hypothetical protein [Patescibacteria group bacterium]